MTHAMAEQSSKMEQYYQFHSKIYDATRWSFLFGREAVIEKAAAVASPSAILEVGCGTGKNMLALGRAFPQAHILGLDISPTMLAVARKRTASLGQRADLVLASYTQPLHPGQFDLILFSYSLTMINPGWEQAIEAAHTDLAEGGIIAAVDFHNSQLPKFKQWMGVNHVRMDGHLTPKMASLFRLETNEVNQAYGGVWQYFIFIGKK